MRIRLLLLAAALIAIPGAPASAVASGPPLANQSDHPVNQPFTSIGFNCATGLPTLITGVFSGVLHTLVRADGSVHFNGAIRGASARTIFLRTGIRTRH